MFKKSKTCLSNRTENSSWLTSDFSLFEQSSLSSRPTMAFLLSPVRCQVLMHNVLGQYDVDAAISEIRLLKLCLSTEYGTQKNVSFV